MNPEEKSLLERTLKMAEDNNAILRSMRRTSRFSATMRVIYWIIVLGFAASAYYFVQPYLMSMFSIIGQAQQILQAGKVQQ